MPMMFVGGRRVAAATITRTGWGATIVVSVALFALAFAFSR
jgi:fumarate reductase subunit C